MMVTGRNRKKSLVGDVAVHDTVLEIGALNRPMLSRGDANVMFADFTDRASLIANYSLYPGFPTDNIVNVDFVVPDGDYVGSVRSAHPGMRFDLIIGSHVAEHIPDFIGWLLQMYELLIPGGHVSLIFPDKRFTFDLIKGETGISDWLTAHENNFSKPSSQQIYRHVHRHLKLSSDLSLWDPPAFTALHPVHTEKEAWDIVRATYNAGSYFDSHCTIVQPKTMLHNLVRLEEAGMFPFELINLEDTDEGSIDFFLKMRKPKDQKAIYARDYEFKVTAEVPYRLTVVDDAAHVWRT